MIIWSTSINTTRYTYFKQTTNHIQSSCRIENEFLRGTIWYGKMGKYDQTCV